MEADFPPASSPLPPPAAPAPPQMAAVLRGLELLQTALLVALLASLVGGVARTYLMAQLWQPGGRTGQGSTILTPLMQIWPLIFIGTELAQLAALVSLGKAPAQARVAEQARAAVGLTALGIALTMVTHSWPYLARVLGEPRQLLMYVSYADTAVALASRILTVEVLLRQRRFAAPNDRAIAENETSLRTGLVLAMVAQIVVSYASFALAFRYAAPSTAPWLAFAMRITFSLLVSGLLLWLVQMTLTAVRAAEQTPAAADPMAVFLTAEKAPETNSAAYRNLLLGGVWAVLGLGLTLVTYQNAQEIGGRYVVAYGAIFAGIVQFIRGLTQLGGRRP